MEDYLGWWQGCSPHYIGIHGIDLGEDKEDEEDIGDT